jgi:hypothetical protein
MIPSDIISLTKEWSTAAHNSNIAAQANLVKPTPQIGEAAATGEHRLNASQPVDRLNLPASVDTPQQHNVGE